MKTKKPKHKKAGNKSAQALLAQAASTKKLVKAARKHLELIKAEQKQARKAYKQARKAAKRARKEAKLALKRTGNKGGGKIRVPKLRPASHLTLPTPKSIARPRRVVAATIPEALVAQVLPPHQAEATA